MIFFKSLKWDTFKHAHPWKVAQCDTLKGVIIVYFHSLVPSSVSKPSPKPIVNSYFILGAWNQNCQFNLSF
jgi:hypothetical protein